MLMLGYQGVRFYNFFKGKKTIDLTGMEGSENTKDYEDFNQ